MRGNPGRGRHHRGAEPEYGRDPGPGQPAHLQSQHLSPEVHASSSSRTTRSATSTSRARFSSGHHSSALEEKLTRPEEMIDCQPGYIVVGGIKMRDSHHDAASAHLGGRCAGSIERRGAIKIGTASWSGALSTSTFATYGFGSTTGIELPGETRGLVKPVKNLVGVVHRLHVHGAGNRGYAPADRLHGFHHRQRRRLHAAAHCRRRHSAHVRASSRSSFRPAEQRRVISPLTAAQMRRMMEDVVLDGTGRARHPERLYFGRARPARRRRSIPDTGRTPQTNT